ncbi:MAG TPA: hypothetical protein VM120_19825 [Bryobacteraceae bacterium]|nr:hypothetical protein [Bryobacteraceae bacterium]
MEEPPLNNTACETPSPTGVIEPRSSQPSNVQWEMVIPKRERPLSAARSQSIPPREKPIPATRVMAEPVALREPFWLQPERASASGFWSRIGFAGAIGVGGVGLLLIGAALLFAARTRDASVASDAPRRVIVGSELPVGASGWIPSFAPTWGPRGPRRIPVLRASLNLTDFRLEFQALIESKSIGWVFRAKDSGNFYVTKLEILQPIPNHRIVLKRFAVINGQEQPGREIAVPTRIFIDTIYKVRLEAMGSHFTTWIQDQKLDEWTDASIPAGGVGLYFDRGEHGTLKGEMRVFPLSAGK